MIQQTILVREIATSSPRWTQASLKPINERFETSSLEFILQWAFDNFAPEIALSTAFGPEGIVLMHHISRMRPNTTVFFLDTDLFFHETYALRDQLAKRLGLTFTRVHGRLSLEEQATEQGAALWTRDPDMCCYLRKVEPLRNFLATQRAWITGIRRDQTRTRAKAGIVEWDYANELVKLNPMANWQSEQVWAYIHEHDLPFNRLHLEGYPSIGCWPCTRAVAPGEDPRAGRWDQWSKTECGIHEHSVERAKAYLDI